MPSNLEIKARAPHFERLFRLAQQLSDTPAQFIEQEDYFFRAERGRLKLRHFADGSGELIAYQRPDQESAKRSDYLISPTPNAALLRETLQFALPLLGVVKKHRTLFLSGQTRIHLDQVENLGNFVELEVVLRPEQSSEEGQAIAEQLIQALQIQPTDLLACAYLDLLLQS